MMTVLLLVHILLAIALIGVVLLQRTEGSGLGFGGGGGGNFMTTRGTANLLTRTTAVIAGLFMATSLALVLLGGNGASRSRSIVDDLRTPLTQPAAPAPAPAQPAAPANAPAQPQGQGPAVPTR